MKKYNQKLLLFSIAAALFLFVSNSFAASTGEGYKLGSQDIITLQIFAGGLEQQKVELTVSGQGTVNVPFIGPTKASGLTASELENKIFSPLEKDYFVDPQVHVQIKEFRSLKYSISGAIKTPGLYEARSRLTIMELIAKAGGVLVDRGNVAYVLRTKGNEGLNRDLKTTDLQASIAKRAPIKISLRRLLDEGDMTNNIVLKPDDVVYIPLEKKLNQTETQIYVEGEVKKPGVFNFQPGMTALGACITAGGFDKYAAAKRAIVIRMENGKQQILKIDLEKVQKGLQEDINLKPGDRLHIPETWL